MNCSRPGFPVLQHLPELTHTHIHWVSDAIQPSHSLSSPSPPAFNLSQHQGLSQWVDSSPQVAKVLEFSISPANEYSELISFKTDSFDFLQFSSFQSLSHVWPFVTPWIAARQASLSITNSWSLLKVMSIESVMPSSHLILCHPLLLLPPIPPSIRVFSNESALRIRRPKYWSFSFSISPSNEHPGLISSRMDWLDLLAVQGTLKCLLQHHSLKTSIFWWPASFMVQLSQSVHDYWKN